jgi:2,4-dienoyl-CoA reductase (NADPH2)
MTETTEIDPTKTGVAPLFEPLELGPRTAHNRIMQAPMSVSYGNADGSVSAKEIEHYGRRAQGGVGVVFTENFAVNLAGRQMPLQTVISEEHLPGLRKLADEVHGHGSLAMVQIVHSGRYAGPWDEYESRRRLAPSAVPFELTPGRTVTPQEMTEEEIEESIEAFVRAAQICERAGFDGVDVHAAQGFLISGFLSRRTNHRTDQWGGSFENRVRFALEVVQRITAGTGPDFVVGVHLLSDELIEGGWAIEDAVRLAPLLEAAGAHFLFAIPATFETLRLPANQGLMNRKGYALADSKALAGAVSIPVIANGRLGGPADMVKALVETNVSAVALARAIFVDPDWPRKVAAGADASIRACPCDPPLCLRTQLTGSVCGHWPVSAQTRGHLGYDEPNL